jgi:hypothetical protein
MIHKLGLILLVSIAILIQLSPNSTYAEFDQWKSTYGKQYSSVIEQSYRKMVFAQNL